MEVSRGRRCGTLRAGGQGIPEEGVRDCLKLLSAHWRFGVTNRRRQHSQPQYNLFSSSIQPLQNSMEGLGFDRGGKRLGS